MNLNPAHLARISDWAATLPPRPLPRTVVPVAGEYHLDYIRRLAEANHIDFPRLTRHLHAPGPPPLDQTATGVEQQRLAATASQPVARITRLHWP